MSRRQIARTLLLSLCALVSRRALAQDTTPGYQAAQKYVYAVTVHIPGQSKVLRLTGFRLAGSKGIVTALHGITGASAIEARNAHGDVLTDLRPQLVDISKDLAILQDTDILMRTADGFAPCTRMSATGDKLTGYGYPHGIALHTLHATVDDPALVGLNTLLVPEVAEIFDRRQSPSPQTSVMNLLAPMAPGDSGAPLLTTEGKVCGVVDGGLPGGQSEISWSIPLIPMPQWSNAAPQMHTIDALASPQNIVPSNGKVLFSLQDEEPGSNGQITLSIGPGGDYHTIEEALDAAPDGGTILVKEGSYEVARISPDGAVSPRIRVNKSVNIVGVGRRENTILIGFFVFLNQVRIENVTVNGRVFIDGLGNIRHSLIRTSSGNAVSVGANKVATVEDGSELEGLIGDKPQGAGGTALNADDGSSVTVTKSILKSVQPREHTINAGKSGKIILQGCTLQSKGQILQTQGAIVEIIDSDVIDATDYFGHTTSDFQDTFEQPPGMHVVHWRNVRW